jgi:hypothetical protein
MNDPTFPCSEDVLRFFNAQSNDGKVLCDHFQLPTVPRCPLSLGTKSLPLKNCWQYILFGNGGRKISSVMFFCSKKCLIETLRGSEPNPSEVLGGLSLNNMRAGEMKNGMVCASVWFVVKAATEELSK